MKKTLSVLALCSVFSAEAATIAVIDSGLDYKHEQIVPNLWTNPLETEDRRDNDDNGYQDDVHGWNFAEQNGDIIDYKYLGTFSSDCKRFFDIQGKRFLGLATAEDLAWAKAKVSDKKFIAELSKFGNFVHGTHVAGITIKDTKNEVMGIKLIPTEIKPFLQGLSAPKMAVDEDVRWMLLEKGFAALAGKQMELLTEIGKFVALHKSDVANGSFGTGFNQAKMISDAAYKIIFMKAADEEASNKAAGIFLKALLTAGKDFVGAAPDTLFVFAAGNDGMSNDDFGTSPANIKADNVISVAATYKNEFIAPFSNYGTKNVDVAAPGMLIKSSIPGNDYLEVSGTSQASPYVAHIAGLIKDENAKLTPAEVKKIILATVDKKAWLKEKVTTGGLVNQARAVEAAKLTKTLSLDEAIKASLQKVGDEPTVKSLVEDKNVTPISLPPMFI